MLRLLPTGKRTGLARPPRLLPPLFALLAALLLAPAASADLTVSGRAVYVDRPFEFGVGFTGATRELPIRFADVSVRDAKTGFVLAGSRTRPDGGFTLVVEGDGVADFFVRVRARTSYFGAAQNVNQPSFEPYELLSTEYLGQPLSGQLDVGTLVSDEVIVDGEIGNPFNILDQLVNADLWLESLNALPLPSPMIVYWPGGQGSQTGPVSFYIADDDGYDDVMQLHEYGHFIQNIYSVPYSPGTRHCFGESDQDPQLAFAEGWATVFAAAVRNFIGQEDPSYFLDALGTGVTGPDSVSLWMSLESGRPYVTKTRGEANEGAIACALYDLIDTAATLDSTPGVDDDPFDGSVLFQGGLTGDELVWRALTSDLMPLQSPTIRDFFYGLFANGDPGFEQQLLAVFDQWLIRFYEDVAEPNQTQATAVQVEANSGWSPTLTLYQAAPGTFAPGDGDRDFYAVEIEGGAVFSVETRYPSGFGDAGTYADPSLRVYRPDGTFFAIDDNSGVGRNALIADQTADQGGTWFVEVFTNDGIRRTGSYQLRVDVTAD